MFGWNRRRGSFSPTSDLDDPLHEMSDIYGQTPPRTRYNRRQRERKQRTSWSESKHSSSTKEPRSKSFLCRRNTFDTIIFDKMCDQADDEEDREKKIEELANDENRKCKRSLKLTRDTERNIKHDFNIDGNISQIIEPRANAKLLNSNNMKVWCGVIETRNRFRCLRSKPVNVNNGRQNIETSQIEFNQSLIDPVNVSDNCELLKSKSEKDRELFHNTFSFLIRLGSNDRERNCRRQMSSEESRWQNELKDLIWLELQAFHADRTPVAQDEYLCKQRDTIGQLLTEIIEYRYDPMFIYTERGSNTASSSDSGIDGLISDLCSGCLSMYCRSCSNSQMLALKQVEHLLCRLETAESLYPSSHAFAAHFPLYKDAAFTGRIKAMCLWYNMTRHHRLKLRILSKLLMLLDKPKINCNIGNDSAINSQSSTSEIDIKTTKIKFDFNLTDNSCSNSTPNSSNNSNSSSSSLSSAISSSSAVSSSSTRESFNCNDYDDCDRLDFCLIEFDRCSYRKYIEEVLKTRGLSKSLNFLERLHTSVLRKASLALKKFDNINDDNINDDYEGDWELRRYGVWSLEAKSLNLPSYRSAFLFLSRVPLDVVHEFLRMRLEQKPEQPGLLSIRQLMREMREGLRIACINRDRFIENFKTVMECEMNNCGSIDMNINDISEFDDSLKAVFNVYLDYLYKWMEIMAFNSDNKNIIEDEWTFVKTIADNINHGYIIGCIKFCNINCMMIEQVKDYLINRPQEIFETMTIINRNNSDNSTVKFQLMSVGREYQGMFVEAREKIMKCLCIAKLLKCDIDKYSVLSIDNDIKKSIDNLKDILLSLRECITSSIKEFEIRADESEDGSMTEHDYLAMHTRIREIFHQAYRMGFDYYKEICKLFCPSERKQLVYYLVNFSMLWMNFVMNKCERGRGLRPRWANHGLEYLMIVCDPLNTRYLTDDEFEELKTNMDRCISHVVGTATSSLDTNNINDHDNNSIKLLSRSRATSPASTSSQLHIKGQINNVFALRSRDNSQNKLLLNTLSSIDYSSINLIIPENNIVKQQRILLAIDKLEKNLDEKRQSGELIGRITDRKSVIDKIRIKLRRVTFTWQRGIKIGHGRFGKVYTVVNNQTGELLAMKEVSLQPDDHIAIRRVAEELEIFEGINHKHLVRYYGIEIQREEMLIFMEFCAEGTLESFVAGSDCGLPEIFIRKYTHQLLLAVSILHSHGIVHRDIKTANIFLTNQANCLKLGDFGSAVKIKSHTTMPGELQGFVGTQAYMAPEVFMKTESIGHGRAADIWSVGCCVIEMSSGKRPWSEYDSNYQIMFKVGMGESPMPPKHLCKEGVDFTSRCLQHDVKKRPTALSLLSHSFARNYDDINADLSVRVIV